MRRLLITIPLIVWFSLPTLAQELKCTVNVNAVQVQGVSQETFNTLKQTIEEFVNTTSWTSMTFQDQERIECSMLIVVGAVTDNVYTCEFTCQSRRPVWGTTYSSPLLNIKDNQFCFTYQVNDRLEYQPNQFASNLVSLLSYYCYLIIGHDMDSFERLGGTPYFQTCENIVTQAQTAGLETAQLAGWKAFDSNRNRYALVHNIMDESFRAYREYYYEYHRLGLDIMSDNATNGRDRIAKGLPTLKQAYQSRPATYLINTFLDAKNDELMNIFKQGTAAEKKQAYDILTSIDPTRQNVYDKINEN